MIMPVRPPAARIERAITSDHVSISALVYPTTIGLPVVPEEPTSQPQSYLNLVCRLLLEKKTTTASTHHTKLAKTGTRPQSAGLRHHLPPPTPPTPSRT